MGTNYYWEPTPKPCPTCGHDPAERTHIGKLSGGWQFSFHGTTNIRSWSDWQTVMAVFDGRIVDEYDRELTIDQLREIVKSSADGMNHYDYCAKEYPGWGDSGTEWKDRDGHSFSASEFF